MIDQLLNIQSRFMKFHQNSLGLDCLLTIFELQGQQIQKAIHDLGMKDDHEVQAIKEQLKMKQNQWKVMYGCLIGKFIGYAGSSSSEGTHQKHSLFNLIRF